MRKRLFTEIAAVIMISMMVFAFCGCGGQDSEQNTQESSQKSSQKNITTDDLLEDESYDINDVLMGAGLEEALDATGVEYNINRFSNITNEVTIETGNEELDGVIGTFMAYAKGDTDYEELPDYRVVGEVDGVVYVLMNPTDTRYDANDPQQCADAAKLTEALGKFVIE